MIGPDLLERLGAAETTGADLGELVGAVERRRVRVLEQLRRRHEGADGVEGVVAELLARWLGALGRGAPAARALVQDPFVGIWSESVLRGARSLTEPGAVARLLGPDVADARRVEVTVATVGRAVHLPRLGGRLMVDSAQVQVLLTKSALELRTADRTVRIRHGAPPPAGAGWVPTPLVEVGAARRLEAQLGSDDPLAATVGPSASVELSDEAVDRWAAQLARAWERLVVHHGDRIDGVPVAAAWIIPQHSPHPDRHVSSSNADGLGAVGISYTDDVPTLALGLWHETRHALLGAALIDVELHHADSTPRFYAGWRPDPRPVGALLQGACAFSAVTDFWRREREVAPDKQVWRRFSLELRRWWGDTREAIVQLRGSGLLTADGYRFVDGLERLTGPKPSVDPDIARAVEDLSVEHRVRWHRVAAGWDQPDDPMPTTLGDAWRHRFFGEAAAPGTLDRVDWSLTAPDPRAALLPALEAARTDRSVAAGLRLARALAHLGDDAAAAAVQRWLVSEQDPHPRELVSGGAAADDPVAPAAGLVLAAIDRALAGAPAGGGPL